VGLRIYSLCTAYKDLTAGSPREREFLQRILTLLDTPRLWFHISPVEVLYWEDAGARLEVGGEALEGLSMPYSKPASVEGRLVALRDNVEGNIVVERLPEDVDDAKYIVIEAARRGAAAVVFADAPPRRVVVTGEHGFKLDAAPTPISVACIEGADRYLGKRARLDVMTRSRVTYSYNLIAFNSFEDTPMISAHWDHWLTGAADNCAGVEAAITAFIDLVLSDVPIALGLFTAEEGVAPHVPSLYWAWGSLNYLSRRGPTLLVNVDVVGVGTPRIYAMPYLHHALRDLAPVESPIPYFDSVHYEMWGMPSLTVSSLRDAWGIYHSALDVQASLDSIILSAELAKRAARIEPRAPQVSLEKYGLARVDEPYLAWSLVYNYLVLFEDFAHSEIVYTDVFQFLKSKGGRYRRVDLLGGPTLCLNNCESALDTYRELALLALSRGARGPRAA